MILNPGKFIVIDGTDGSGKTTQFNLLKNKLEADGHIVEIADFPQYNTKSAGLVEEYLSGKYGSADEVTAYQASIFYAVDRYDASFKIRQWLREGKIVLANRYTSANLGHQGCKIDNPLERKVFFNWLYDLEYKIFNIPKPDLSIILHVDSEIAQKLALGRKREDWNGKTTDIHEENINHLKKAEQVYLEIANSFPDYKLIECTKNNEILSREEIHWLVWLTVSRIISKPLSPKENTFRPISDLITSNQAVATKAVEVISSEGVKDNYQLLVEKLNPQAKLLQKAHSEDAGYDLYASDYYSLPPYGQALVSTGLKLNIPTGLVGLIWDKSGLAFEGIKTMGGVIDSNYRGEIKVVVKNLSEEFFNIIPGQKVAQILFQPVLDLEIKEEKINDNTERAAAGFGSSGKF